MTMPERPNDPPPPSLLTGSPVFADFHFIMVAPSHPGNVGAAARALKTMGFKRLVLVQSKPKIITHPDAIAMASGALDVLEEAQLADTLAQALAPMHLSFALSARSRYLGPPPCTIRTAAQQAVSQHQQQRSQIAFVLGTERMGLTNEQTALCNYLCHIPANPAYSSLNVAQALQLVAWELRYALLTQAPMPTEAHSPTTTQGHSTAGNMAELCQDFAAQQSFAETQLLPQAPRGKKHQRARPATSAEVGALLTHWLTALQALDFISPAEQKRIPERMAHFFRRAQMREDEVSLFRGVCSAMLRKAGDPD